MKSILYVGATLMIGASVYGFVDYKKTSHRKEFTDMYAEKKKTEPVVAEPEKKSGPVIEKTTPEKTKPRVVKRKITAQEEAPVIVKPLGDDEKMRPEKKDLIGKTSVDITPAKETSISSTVKKKRKLSTRLFSRAPLREEVEEQPAPVKEDKKSKNKQQ